MGITDNDVQKQLRHMMAFIEQEANEKAEEIDEKAEEEFQLEKGRLFNQQRQKILEYYEKKEKQVELQRKIQGSYMLNQGRLKCLKARESILNSTLDEACTNLSRIASDAQRYPAILKGLIMQGLFRILEKEVTIRCKKVDLVLVRKLLPECLKELENSWGNRSNVIVNEVDFLPPGNAGGVILLAKGGRIQVSSTLESRLDLIAAQIVPTMRTALFGTNPSRCFYD